MEWKVEQHVELKAEWKAERHVGLKWLNVSLGSQAA